MVRDLIAAIVTHGNINEVALFSALDALHTALISYAMYDYLIQNALNPSGWTALSPAMKVR